MIGRAFISYRHGHDSVYVDRLSTFLENAGVPVWLDREMVTGDRWEQVIRTELDASAALIVIMTPASEESPWVMREIGRAEDTGKPILPVLLEGKEFFRLNNIQYENVIGARMPTQAFIERAMRCINGDDTAVNSSANESGRGEPGGLTASLPYLFDETAYVDLQKLFRQMSAKWSNAKDHTGRQWETLNSWLRDYVRDRTLPANILHDGTEDDRIARLAAHFDPEGPPLFYGERIDAVGIVQLCKSNSPLLQRLTPTLIGIFASYPCRASHSQCRDNQGCVVLRDLPVAIISSLEQIHELLLSCKLPYGNPLELLSRRVDPNTRREGGDDRARSLRFSEIEARVLPALVLAVVEPSYDRVLVRSLGQIPSAPRSSWWSTLESEVQTIRWPAIGRVVLLVTAQKAVQDASREREGLEERELREIAYRTQKTQERWALIVGLVIMGVVVVGCAILAIAVA